MTLTARLAGVALAAFFGFVPPFASSANAQSGSYRVIGVGDIMMGSNFPTPVMHPKLNFGVKPATLIGEPLAALLRSGDVVFGNMEGTIPLSPPTLVTLHDLLKYGSIKDLQDESRQRPWGPVLFPRLVPLAKGAVIVEPWDPQYGDDDIRIGPEDLPSSILSVGEPFSRIWYDGRLWRPIRA